MAEMTRRLQILIDEERWSRLERHAGCRGTSIATLVRDAIDAAYPQGEPSAAEAADSFLTRAPHDLGDWSASKAEIEDGLLRSSQG